MSNLIKQLVRRGMALVLVVAFTSTLVVFVPTVTAGGHRDNGPVRAAGDGDGISGNKYEYQIDPQGGGGDWVDRSKPGTGGSSPTIKVRVVFFWDSLLRAASILARR